MRRRYGGLKTADSETPKITVATIEAISTTTGIGDSFWVSNAALKPQGVMF